MTFHDRERAEHYLRELNYYRLAGYWLRRESDHGSHTFEPGTCFEDVLADYVFDRELKLLVLDAVERLEVSVRTRWAHDHRDQPRLTCALGQHAVLRAQPELGATLLPSHI